MSETRASSADLMGTLARAAVGVIAYVLFGVAAGRVLGLHPSADDVESLLVAHGCGCVGFCLAAAVLPASVRLVPARGSLAAPLFYVVFLLLWVPFVVFAYTWLLHRLSVPFEPQEQLAYFGGADRGRWQFAAALATVVFVGPLAEEYAFRGYCQDALAALAGGRFALVGTAAVFGVFHGLVFAVPLAMLGLLFGWLRVRYRSLAPGFVVHVLHNGLTVAVMLAAPDILNEAYR
ncbi:MAG: CPBP family intramembrane glutamic endopeptidase [Planctomycetota bacterium]